MKKSHKKVKRFSFFCCFYLHTISNKNQNKINEYDTNKMNAHTEWVRVRRSNNNTNRLLTLYYKYVYKRNNVKKINSKKKKTTNQKLHRKRVTHLYGIASETLTHMKGAEQQQKKMTKECYDENCECCIAQCVSLCDIRSVWCFLCRFHDDDHVDDDDKKIYLVAFVSLRFASHLLYFAQDSFLFLF